MNHNTMKQTVNVNISSVAFIMDEDAYNLLKKYLDDIELRLDSSDLDSIEDIENRIAGMFSEKIVSPIQVVSIDMVRMAIAVIGKPETFGARNTRRNFDNDFSMQGRKLYRSDAGKMIGGVCSGIAEYFGWDATVVRVVAIILSFFGGLNLLVYILLWIVIPKRVNYVK